MPRRKMANFCHACGWSTTRPKVFPKLETPAMHFHRAQLGQMGRIKGWWPSRTSTAMLYSVANRLCGRSVLRADVTGRETMLADERKPPTTNTAASSVFDSHTLR